MRSRYTHEARTGLWRCAPGIGSEFIRHLPDLLAEGRKPVVAYCRVSSEKQKAAGNLDDEVTDAIERLRAIGITRGQGLAAVVQGVESSRIQDDRPLLEKAIEEARIREGIVVATSRDRFIRSRGFDRRNKTEVPTIAEYLQLERMADDVALATLCHPDQPARSDQIKRGQAAKGNRGGRPKKRKWKQRRLARIDLARKMREEGNSYQHIADLLNVRDDGFCDQTAMTVHNWLRRAV